MTLKKLTEKGHHSVNICSFHCFNYANVDLHVDDVVGDLENKHDTLVVSITQQ